MRTASLTLALLVAAALAGCTGGTSTEGQLPDETGSGTGTSSDTGTSAPRGRGGNGTGVTSTYNATLEVSPANGTAPLNVTITYSATWEDQGQRTRGNGTAGASGNGTAGRSGNSTGNASANANQGSHPVNRGHDVSWTLVVTVNGTAGAGNGTAGNSTGGSTGNSTGNSTTSSTTSPTGSGNATGNQTGNSTTTSSASPSGSGNSTGNQTGGSANGTVIASWNGTSEDLPGNQTLMLDAAGTYDVTFTVTPHEGDQTLVRTRSVVVEDLPPGSPLGNETATFEGSALVAPGLCASEEFEWVLNATFGGRSAEAAQLNLTMDTGGFGSWEMVLVAPNGTEVGSGEEIGVEGSFEAGNYTLTVETCLAADADFTVTAVAHYVTPRLEDAGA